MPDLNIAEISYEDGTIRFRYARYRPSDSTRWVRHGLFLSYHPCGTLASEGMYLDGTEDGLWTEFHPNGQMATRGHYKNGQEAGHWAYWNDDGSDAPA